MKKLFWILLIVGLIAVLLIGCTLTVPSEGEGEGEGEGEVEVTRVVMVEAFLREYCANCAIVEPIIEQLADEYDRSEVIFLEERAYELYSLDEIRDRYAWYVPIEENRGTPRILCNGLNQNIYSSSTYATIKGKINLELAKEAKISISADRSSNSTTTTISGTIKNISSSTLDSLVVNGMVFKDRGETGLRYSVADILEEQKETIATFGAGSSYNFSLTLSNDINWDANHFHGVIFVQDTNSSTKEILQAYYVD